MEIKSSMGKKGVEPYRALRIQNFKTHKKGRLVASGSKRKLETQKGGVCGSNFWTIVKNKN